MAPNQETLQNTFFVAQLTPPKNRRTSSQHGAHVTPHLHAPPPNRPSLTQFWLVVAFFYIVAKLDVPPPPLVIFLFVVAHRAVGADVADTWGWSLRAALG